MARQHIPAIPLRNESGDVILRRQVSTRREKVEEFLEQVHQLGAADGGAHVAILEVCGFHDWLVKRLQQDEACREVVVIQPITRSRKKTDRRDANAIRELLWVNRIRLLRGERVQGIRRIYIPQESDQQDRLLTRLRVRLVWKRTETLRFIRSCVAVMRRLVVIMWHILTERKAWRTGVKPERTRPAMDDPRAACKPIDRQALLAQYPAPSASPEMTAGSTGSSSLFSDEEVEPCQM